MILFLYCHMVSVHMISYYAMLATVAIHTFIKLTKFSCLTWRTLISNNSIAPGLFCESEGEVPYIPLLEFELPETVNVLMYKISRPSYRIVSIYFSPSYSDIYNNILSCVTISSSRDFGKHFRRRPLLDRHIIKLLTLLYRPHLRYYNKLWVLYCQPLV